MQRVAPNDPEVEAALKRAQLRQAHGWLRAAELQLATALGNREKRVAQILEHACLKLIEEDNPHWLRVLPMMQRWPVTIDEFLNSKDFLGDIVDVWPTLQQDVFAINPDIMLGEGPIHQVLIGGATNTGKTEVSKVSLLYRTYLLTCFKHPQHVFHLNQATMLVVMFQNVQITQTRRVQYDPFRANFLAMPYTRKYIRYDKHREASLVLKDLNIEITMGLPTVQAMVGAAIVLGHQDEVNFMQVVENSKQVAGAAGQGGFFDQAEIAFRNMTRRRKGRMSTQGPDFSLIAVTSSTRYKDDFLDRRMDEAEKNGEIGVGDTQGVLMFRHKQYEVQPPERYRGEKIRVLVGNDYYGTRLIGDDEVEGKDYPEGAHVEIVPAEFKSDFQTDPEGSLRDVIGISSNALTPYITQRHKIAEAVVRGRQRGLKLWVEKQDVNLTTEGMPQFVEENMPPRDTRALETRYVHIDLSKSKDRCGIAVVKVDGHKAILDEKTGVREYLPAFVVEMAVSIKPSAAKEIDISEVRQWVMLLHTYYGFRLGSVTYDGYQSAESMMMWRKAGVPSFHVTNDTTTEVYDAFKSALYQDRVDIIESEVLRIELGQLEQNDKTGKIDHPPKGSKDVSDAVSSACYAASRARDVREHTKVTMQVAETNKETGEVTIKEVGNTPTRRRVVRRAAAKG